MSLDFYCNIQMAGSDFGTHSTKASIHPVLFQLLISTEHWLNPKACMGIAEHVYAFYFRKIKTH